MNVRQLIITLCAATMIASVARAEIASGPKELLVPYKELPLVFEAAEKIKILDRKDFDALLKDAKRPTATAEEIIRNTSIMSATYSATIDGRRADITGELTLRSMCNEIIVLPLQFGGIGLTDIKLDGKPAQLGFDGGNTLQLILSGKGDHKLTIAGTSSLRESSVGMSLIVAIPQSIAGEMNITAPGDTDIQSLSPVSKRNYDKKIDRTTASIAIAGCNPLAVLLSGNGRQEGSRVVLLGDIQQIVQIGEADQSLNCLANVMILRRGVRELDFTIPAGWTVTDVSSDNMVKWSVADAPANTQKITVTMLKAQQGPQAVQIKAIMPRKGNSWQSSAVTLDGAAFQRGYLCVDIGENLRVRSEDVSNAQREDVAVAPVYLRGAGSRLYSYWGNAWNVKLTLAEVTLRQTCKATQTFSVDTKRLALDASFDITAIGRQLYDMQFTLPAQSSGFELMMNPVTVNGSATGFDYNVKEKSGKRTLFIRLARPIEPEAHAIVRISMQSMPTDWKWQDKAITRKINMVQIVPHVQNVSGLLSIVSCIDLAVKVDSTAKGLTAVPVGQMASLGLATDVQHAYRYATAETTQAGTLTISRQTGRVSCNSIGLVTVSPGKLAGRWQLNYDITRASMRELRFMAAKNLGRQISVTVPGRRMLDEGIILPDAKAAALGYNVWLLKLESPALGKVSVDVSFEHAMDANTSTVPLIRPIAGQSDELIALQVSDEIAVNIKPLAVREVDTVDLPQLPGASGRLVAAYQLSPLDSPKPSTLTLQTTVYSQYAIPAAFVLDAKLITLIGPDGGQQTQASYKIINAGMQFLRLAMPPHADLWSIRVGEIQSRPQCNQAGEYLIPLKLTAAPQRVTVVYAVKGEGSLNRLQLGAVKLPDIIVNDVTWNVIPPTGYHISSKDTAMQARDFSMPTPAYISILESSGRLLTFGGIMLPSLSSSRELAKRAMTMTTLNGIGKGIMLYQSAHETEEWPESLEVLVKEGYISQKMLVDTNGYRIEYIRPTQPDVPGNQIVARTALVNGFRAVLYASGGVGKVDENTQMASAEVCMPESENEELTENENLEASDRESTFGDSVNAPAASSPKPNTISQTYKPKQQMVAGVPISFLSARVEGRYTLPVSLDTYIDSENGVKFTGLGETPLVVSATKNVYTKSWSCVGFAVVLFAGVLMLRAKLGRKTWFVAGVLCVSSLIAVWFPQTVAAANGAFYGGLCMAGVYILLSLLRAIFRIRRKFSTPAIRAAVIIAALTAISPAAFCSNDFSIVIPYEGSPLTATNSQKVMMSYDKYVEMWNLAHPKERIEAPAPVGVSLGNVQYDATINGEKFSMTLTADVKTYHAGPQMLTMPFSGLAVTSAEFNGKPAQLQNSPAGMMLMLPGKSLGQLKITAAATCKILGQKGNVEFNLPPLPGATMCINLPEKIDLAVQSVSEPLTYRKLPSGDIRWTIPLRTTNHIQMEWAPKVGTGNADKTLTAVVYNNVCAKPWAMVGESSVTYNFTAGQLERFGMLLPSQATIVNIVGDNIRDFGITGQKELDGIKYDVIEIRLQRPAVQSCTMQLSWLAPLPKIGQSARLLLPQCADVARESGSVCLLDSGGVELKVEKMNGGRRTDISTNPDASATAVAQYAWPYRPFDISIKLTRPATQFSANVNQLVRISSEQAELFVNADFTAKEGNLFGASFILPAGYELTSVAGPAVEDWYARPTPEGQRLDVNFRKAVNSTNIALAMNKMQPHLADFSLPVVAALDASGKPVATQTGMLAVQMNNALDAETLSCENLKPVVPQLMRVWLDSPQIPTVRFAYQRTSPEFALKLKIVPKPTHVRVDEFTGITVQSTAANYTYLLRYFISGSPVDHVSFTLPDHYASLVAVDSPLKRNVTSKPLSNGRTQWTVWLQNEVTGTLDVTANFALPLDDQTTQLPVPQVQTSAPNGYKAIIAVRNLSRHELSLGKTAKLTAMPVEEQERDLPAEQRSNLLYIFQTFDTDWQMSMNFKPAPAATRVQAVVDLMATTTVIDPSGQCRYEVVLTLQNRSEQFLHIVLPKDLGLWSASVAGQPVKPVVPSTATAGEVLIPLVKTSPGGLPYDVKLYLGGKVVKKFDGLTKLAPPAVKVTGVGVMRTTWSLRLPGGYRYMNMEGNMSPIAGEAEIMSIEIGAKIEQFRRMRKSYESIKGGGRQKEVARRNIEQFQEELKSEVSRAENFVQNNSGKISDKESNRLQVLLGGQKQVVEEEVKLGTDVINKTDAQQADLNRYLNDSSQASSRMSVSSNSAQPIPEFMRQAGEQQLQAIRSELNESLPQDSGASSRNEVPWYVLLRYPKDADKVVQLKKGQTFGIAATANDFQAVKMEQGQAVQNMAVRRLKVEKQLQQATSNYYGNEQSKSKMSFNAQAVNESDIKQSPAMPEVQRGINNRRRQATREITRSRALSAFGSSASRQQQPAVACEPASNDSSCVGTNAPMAIAAPIPTAEPAPYVAAGTFSLPMTLPEGELHLDYAMPGSGAELSIYAVPVTWIDNMWGTISVIVGLIVFSLFYLAIRRISKNGAPSTKHVLGMSFAGVLILMFAGTIGVAIFLAILFVAELLKCRKKAA